MPRSRKRSRSQRECLGVDERSSLREAADISDRWSSERNGTPQTALLEMMIRIERLHLQRDLTPRALDSRGDHSKFDHDIALLGALCSEIRPICGCLRIQRSMSSIQISTTTQLLPSRRDIRVSFANAAINALRRSCSLPSLHLLRFPLLVSLNNLPSLISSRHTMSKQRHHPLHRFDYASFLHKHTERFLDILVSFRR